MRCAHRPSSSAPRRSRNRPRRAAPATTLGFWCARCRGPGFPATHADPVSRRVGWLRRARTGGHTRSVTASAGSGLVLQYRNARPDPRRPLTPAGPDPRRLNIAMQDLTPTPALGVREVGARTAPHSTMHAGATDGCTEQLEAVAHAAESRAPASVVASTGSHVRIRGVAIRAVTPSAGSHPRGHTSAGSGLVLQYRNARPDPILVV